MSFHSPDTINRSLNMCRKISKTVWFGNDHVPFPIGQAILSVFTMPKQESKIIWGRKE